MRYGICSTCQAKHEVRYHARDGWYVMATHDFPTTTKHCDGSGQVPEAVIGDSEAQRETDEWDDMAMMEDYWAANGY